MQITINDCCQTSGPSPLIAVLTRIARAIERLTRPPRPRNFQAVAISERRISDMDFIQFKLTVDPSSAGDAVSRELSQSIDGAAPVVTTFPAATVEFPNLEAPQGSAVHLELVDIDDAGNRSSPAILDFTASDTLPPQAPTGLGVTVTGERTV